MQRILVTALIAGLAAGLVNSAAQMVLVAPLIEKAETLERADADSAAAGDGAASSQPAAWAPADGFQRAAFTVLANLLVGIGFALFLAAAFALRGSPMDGRRGLAWGLAGFCVFALAPALGLPPEPPGMAAADLSGRQGWWLMTAGATAVGLALLVFASGRAARIAGLVLLVAPHVIGAPVHQAAAPSPAADMALEFALASLAATALFWSVLGGVSGIMYRKLA